jgi:hypothetical protein
MASILGIWVLIVEARYCELYTKEKAHSTGNISLHTAVEMRWQSGENMGLI